jgi:hypothetical protein
MDAVSSKISNKEIIKLVVTTLILTLINTAYFWVNDNYILSGDPQHPHNPPFDNLAVRMVTREISIWIFFLLNVLALTVNGMQSQKKLLLFTTILLDVVTILIAVLRIVWDHHVLYDVYNTILGFLNSNLFFAVLVILHYIAVNLDNKVKN